MTNLPTTFSSIMVKSENTCFSMRNRRQPQTNRIKPKILRLEFDSFRIFWARTRVCIKKLKLNFSSNSAHRKTD